MTSGNNPWELNKISKDLYTWIGDNETIGGIFSGDGTDNVDTNTTLTPEQQKEALFMQNYKGSIALTPLFQ
jgi:hypothetical protein